MFDVRNALRCADLGRSVSHRELHGQGRCQVKNIGFLTLILLAVSVDPTRLPPFVWCVIAILASCWYIVFAPSRKDW